MIQYVTPQRKKNTKQRHTAMIRFDLHWNTPNPN